MTWVRHSVFVVFIGVSGIANRLYADESLAAAVPPRAVVFLEANGVGEALTRLEKSAGVALLTSTPQWQAYLRSADYQRFDAGRRLVEAQLGMDAFDAFKRLLGRRLSIAIYPRKVGQRPDVVVVVRAGDRALLDKTRSALDAVVRFVGPTVVDVAARVDKTLIFTVQNKMFYSSEDDWIVGASTRELAKKSIELLKKKSTPSLASAGKYAGVAANIPNDSLIRMYIDIQQVLAASGGGKEPVKFDNVVGAWLFGGVAELARQTPFAIAGLSIDANAARLTIRLPVDWKNAPVACQGFFAGQDSKAIANLPVVDDCISQFAMWRDFGRLYKGRESNLQARILPEFDKFESGLANILPGRSFAEDVLPLLGKKVAILVGKQGFSHLSGEPALKLPGFAVVFEPDASEQANDMFQLLFQSIVAILNFQVGERGGEPMVIRNEVHHNVPIAFGRHMRSNLDGPLPIGFNFTPAMARVGNRLILSSSLDFCRQLVDGLTPSGIAKEMDQTNATFVAHARAIVDELRKNRSFLESKIMQSGKSATQAKSDFELGLKLLGLLKDLKADGGVKSDSYELRLSLSWN